VRKEVRPQAGLSVLADVFPRTGMRCGGAPLARTALRTALRRVFDMLKRLSTLFLSVALAAPITLHASSGAAAAACAQGVTREGHENSDRGAEQPLC
jgi:hypothetical protein